MADIILEVTIPDGYKDRVIIAFDTIAGKNLTLEAEGDGFEGSWSFVIAPKGSSETYKEYGQRVLRVLGKAVMNLVDLKEDKDRYRTEVAAIVNPASDVPTDILT